MKTTARSNKFARQAKRPRARAAKSKVKKTAETPSFNEEFKKYIGIIKDGPTDLARNHKLYASGAKKWK